MNLLESKPVYYLKMTHTLTGVSDVETYYTLLELLKEIDYIRNRYLDIETYATVIPSSKQEWLDDILTRDNLK